MKVKIFEGTSEGVEREINEFLKEIEVYEYRFITQSESWANRTTALGPTVTISIFYN